MPAYLSFWRMYFIVECLHTVFPSRVGIFNPLIYSAISSQLHPFRNCENISLTNFASGSYISSLFSVQPVSERIFTSIKRATFHTHLNPKGTVSGDGFTLRLGHSGKEGGQHLAGHFRGINMFFSLLEISAV